VNPQKYKILKPVGVRLSDSVRLEGRFESFDEAAKTAVHRFGRGPYLIRQVGAGPITLPASVMYRPVYADR
jgi:hypothetical protein